MRRGLLLRVPKWPRVYTRPINDVNVSIANMRKAFLGLLATLTLAGGFSLRALADVVYIRNQRLAVQQVEGQRVVNVDAFRALLTEPESKACELADRSLTLTNSQGARRAFALTPYGELAAWEEALEWLGYQRRENSGTGVVDWVNSSAGTGAATVKVWTEPTEDELAKRKEYSERRAGYRLAERNFRQVYDSVGQGGTEADRKRIRRLGYQIVDQTPLRDLHWTFDVIATPIPNALCTGEGWVLVTEGLLNLNLTDDEMAGVLGHEVAHGVRRHTQLFEERYNEVKRLLVELRELERDAAKAEADNDAHRLKTIRSRLNELSPRMMFLKDWIENQQAYNHSEEEEADILGMQFAAAAGFDPFGEGRALIKLRAASIEMFGQAYKEGSRTHPPLKRRLEIAKLVQQRWQKEREKSF